MRDFMSIRWLGFVALIATLAGCTVHPPGEREERNAALQSGQPFAKRFERRQIRPLPENPTLDQLAEYALLNNAELERRYWEWRSAVEQIPQDATQTATLNLAAGVSIANGRASWSSSTLTASNDPMTDLKWPGKLDAAARVSLENARAAGQRFVKAKYELRSKVIIAYYDFALNAEWIRLEQRRLQLLRTTAAVTEARNRAGNSGQQDVLQAGNEAEMSANDIANLESQLPPQRAAINALLGRRIDAPLPTPTHMPIARSLALEDREVTELAMKRNPELIALADENRSRTVGIRVAKLQYVPDFNLSAGTDLMGVTQSVLAQATIPFFRYEAIDAAIAQAEANLRASEATRRQASNDLVAETAADIAAIRDADRQLSLFEQNILPRARQMVNIGRAAYETGRAPLLDLLNEQRSLIGLERLVANLMATRAKRLAELESITASDLSLPGRPAPVQKAAKR